MSEPRLVFYEAVQGTAKQHEDAQRHRPKEQEEARGQNEEPPVAVPPNLDVETSSALISFLSLPTIALRDHDIICSNGMTDHYQDGHPGNVQMKEIVNGFVREWNETEPEQRNEKNILERIKSEIAEQPGTPTFLMRNIDDTKWGIAKDEVIGQEILGEWRRQIDGGQQRNGNDPNMEKALSKKDQLPGNEETKRGEFLRHHKIIIVVAVVILVVLIVDITLRAKQPKDDREVAKEKDTVVEPEAGSPTLSDILKRKKLNCGVMPWAGFAKENEQGIWEGFDVDLCRAVAAGIFGQDSFLDRKTEPIEFVPLEAEERFHSLNNKEVDLLVAMTPHTMERSFYEESTKKGYTFSTPYLVTGLRFAGTSEYLPCVTTNSTKVEDGDLCQSTRVCVVQDTYEETLMPYLSALGLEVIVFASSKTQMYEMYKNEDCDLLIDNEFDLSPEVLQDFDRETPTKLGNEILSKELFSMVTRDGDAFFSDFVNYILQSLMTAEEERVRRSAPIEASDLATTEVFGSRYQTMFQDAFAVVGHYGELYGRHLETLASRSLANEINGNTAAIYSKPLGNLEADNPTDQKSPIIDEIRKRGSLRVGVTDAPMFSLLVDDDWVGIDIDFANAVAAALFDGDTDDKVDFVVVTPADRFVKLESGEIDMLARTTTITMERDVKERKTGHGFTFSTPMFHDQIRFVGRDASYVECAEKDFTIGRISADCPKFVVCLANATTQYTLMSMEFEDRLIVKGTTDHTVEAFANGECEVFASGMIGWSEASIAKYYEGPYFLGEKAYSRESRALVTKQDDVVFSKLVDLVVNAIVYADENSITKTDYVEMPRINLFRPWVSDTTMLRSIISAVGNYQEIWDRHFGILNITRDARNGLNTFPFGPMLITEQTWDRPPPLTG